MGQKRILIGFFVSILVFSFVLLLGNSFWFGINQIFLGLQSKISFTKKLNNENSIILEFDKDLKEEFLKNTSSLEKKESFIKASKSLDLLSPLSINIVLSKNNIVNLTQNDIDGLRKTLNTPIQSIENKDIELSWLNDNNKRVLLNHKESKIDSASFTEFQTGLVDDDLLRSKNIFLISPDLNLSTQRLNLLINYFENRYIKFIPFSKFLLFLAIFAFAVLSSLMSYPPRIALFAAVSSLAYLISQISYSFFNSYLEISTLILGLLFTLLAVSVFDVDFQDLSALNFFKEKQIAAELKNLQIKNYSLKKKEEPLPYIKSDESPQQESSAKANSKKEILEELRFDLKNQFYTQLETKLEEKALEIEEKCFDSVNTIQEKLIELLSESELSERDNLRLGLVKHNFDQLLNEIDHCLFSMVPFQFEKEQGFIDILEYYATKLYFQNKAKVKLDLATNVSPLELSQYDKTNIFRIIENLVSNIIQYNFDGHTALEIKLQIKEQGDKLNFYFGYPGKSIETLKEQIKETHQRLSSIKDAQLSFENKVNFSYIKLQIQNSSAKVPSLN